MNEKIKELQKAAGIQVVRTLMREDENTEVKLMLTESQLEKFAELIVKECAEISDHDAVGDDPACCTNTAYRIARHIEKHFGVEE